MKANHVILLLGSNIDPERNISLALEMLAKQTTLVAKSRIWETEAVGSHGPNFLNAAVKITSELGPVEIKKKILTPIENHLKRVRTADKYAPRTIDIDIVLHNDLVLDDNLWTKVFVALPVSELLPDLRHPKNNTTLLETASQLKSSAFAELFIPS